jgi:hypothetical protein
MGRSHVLPIGCREPGTGRRCSPGLVRGRRESAQGIPWSIPRWHLRATRGLHQWASRVAPTGHFLATSGSLDSSGRDARNRQRFRPKVSHAHADSVRPDRSVFDLDQERQPPVSDGAKLYPLPLLDAPGQSNLPTSLSNPIQCQLTGFLSWRELGFTTCDDTMPRARFSLS